MEELAQCLILVVPTGMTQNDRRDWIRVARKELGHLPWDLLVEGCREAKKICDHPSKVVPAIIAATDEDYRRRKNNARETALLLEARDAQKFKADPVQALLDMRGHPMSEQELDILNGYLRLMDAKVFYRMDGSSYDRVTGETIRPKWNGYVMSVPPDVLKAAYERWERPWHPSMR